MLGVQYFKADSSTYVIKTSGGKVRQKGKGLSFFYNATTTSVATIPINTQEAPFIFRLQTSDYQEVTVQGQVTFRIGNPNVIAEMMNFTLKQDGRSYVSEDPLKLSDRVVRAVGAVIQDKVQSVGMRESLALARPLVEIIKASLEEESYLQSIGVDLVDVSIGAIKPSTETSRALEAEARELILKEADDAIYARRKSAVEQERTVKEAELQTELSVQQKEQEIEESRIANERAILRGKAETEQEGIQAEIDAEEARKALVLLNVENKKQEADSDAYAVRQRMDAFTALPVENLKAMALANMQPEQLMAMAFESLAQNAAKIGELNISPDLFGQVMKKAARK